MPFVEEFDLAERGNRQYGSGVRERYSGRWPAVGALAGVAAALTMFVGQSTAALPQQSGSVSLPSQANFTVAGASSQSPSDPLADRAGEAVASAGDVNRDGLADVVIGAKGVNSSSFNFGAAYVVFGSTVHQGSVDLSGLGRSGFRIEGETAADFAGAAVGGAGDVNGDGFSDVVVGAGNAGVPGATPGSAYVVFGKADTSSVSLSTLAATGQGFEIEGAADADLAGFSVALVSDMTGDGRSEIVVGAPSVGSEAGAAYLVFGKASSAPVSLSALGAAGFQMNGSMNSQAGRAVAGLGDVNGDGRGDLAVGAPGASASNGAAYVVFGRQSVSALTLESLTASEGYRLGTPPPGVEGVGESVAGLGDLSGDGRPDIAVGGTGDADPPGRTNGGAAYAAFAPFPPRDVDLANLDPMGFRIIGAAQDFLGRRVAGAGDFNGNGSSDVLVSAPCADAPGLVDAGKAYLVDGSPIQQADAAALGGRGVVVSGGFAESGGTCPDPGDPEVSVAGIGDFNGDARPDVLIGMARNDPNGRANAGAAYVLYGFGAPEVAYPGGIAVLTGEPASTAPSRITRTGGVSFSVTPALPAGLALDSATGAITGSRSRSYPRTVHTVNMTDLAGTATAAVPIAVSSPDRDGDGVTVEAGDCEDDPAKNGARRAPGRKEIPNNRIDENCNDVLGFDRDRDRYLARPEGTDCDDRDRRERPEPGRRDVPGNNLDEDCKGGKKRGEIKAKLFDRWRFIRDNRAWRTTQLDLRGIPAGTTIRLDCQARGCPKRTPTVRLKRRARTFDVRRRFRSFFRKSGIGVGGRLTINLRKPNNAAKEFRIRFRVKSPNCTVIEPRREDDCTRHPMRRTRASHLPSLGRDLGWTPFGA